MDRTPASLLELLRRPGDPTAWSRFANLCTPFLYQCAARLGLQEPDAADLVQEVFLVLIRTLPDFHHDPHKSFRAWLRTIFLNKWRDHCKRRAGRPAAGAAALADLAGPDDQGAFDEADYRRHLVARALELMQAEFQPATWKSCWEVVVRGRPAAAVAAELGLSENAVYIAKCRVLRRLRQELAGLLD